MFAWFGHDAELHIFIENESQSLWSSSEEEKAGGTDKPEFDSHNAKP